MGNPFGQINATKIKFPSAFNNNYVKCDATGLLLPITIAQIKIDLGVGQQTRQIFSGSSLPTGGITNQNISIPSWANWYRYRLQAPGSGSSSGIVQPTTTTAANGGATGAAGFFLERSGQISELTALGSTIALAIGAPGAGGAPSTNTTYNLGTSGGDITLTIGSTVIATCRGGQGVTTANTGASNGGRAGGVAGSNGISSSTAGVIGNGSQQLEIAASGGTGGGLTTGNIAAAGGSGSRGGTLQRSVVEALSAGGAIGTVGNNAVAVLVNGLPCPGNSPGGGGSSNTGNGGKGGDGVNGSSGGGGGSSRTGSSGAGGNGGNGYAIIEFY